MLTQAKFDFIFLQEDISLREHFNVLPKQIMIIIIYCYLIVNDTFTPIIRNKI